MKKFGIFMCSIALVGMMFTSCEGKKNEVRIVLAACGCPVHKLHRVSFGNIKLKTLPVGKIEQVPQKTIDELLKSL